jgi:hypothetical protein
MGLLDRESRQVRAKVVPNVKRETLQSEILNHIAQGSKVYTDNATGYMNLAAQQHVRETVSRVEEYVRGEVHTNGLENFWSLLKRSLRGTYVAVEPFHLDRYGTGVSLQQPSHEGKFAERRGSFHAGGIADFREETDLCRTDRQGGRNQSPLMPLGSGGRIAGRGEFSGVPTSSILRDPLVKF